MEQDELRIEREHDCVQLRLNRPERHNAFDDSLMKQIYNALETLKKDPTIRLLTISATGQSFSAGADLDWMRRVKNYSPEENYQDSKLLRYLLSSLANFPSPTLALVNGSAFGGGIGLIACCDIAISVDTAQFCFSEAKLGLVPALISPYIIRAIGLRQAQKLFLTAETFSAAQAVQYGLIHSCCAATELEACYRTYREFIFKNGPNALREIKNLIQLHERTPDMDIHDLMVERITAIRSSPEAQAGLSAFLEKRPISWQKQSNQISDQS